MPVLLYLSGLLFLLTSEMLASSQGSEGKGKGENFQDTNYSEVTVLSKYPSPGFLSISSYTGYGCGAHLLPLSLCFHIIDRGYC